MSQPVPLAPPRKLIDLEIDGSAVRVAEGDTILDACRSQGVDTPTLCYAENLTPPGPTPPPRPRRPGAAPPPPLGYAEHLPPQNACRVCVVEVEGARTLVP